MSYNMCHKMYVIECMSLNTCTAGLKSTGATDAKVEVSSKVN